MEEALRILVNADTAMVGVTFVICQLIKRALPSDPGKEGVWTVAARFAWIPFAAAFVVGTALSVALNTSPGATIIAKVRAGLQTGAYSVIVWEVWSNGKKIVGGAGTG